MGAKILQDPTFFLNSTAGERGCAFKAPYKNNHRFYYEYLY